MTNTTWLWEYQLRIFDNIDSREEIRCGVVTANTLSGAVKRIEDYYEDEIIEILNLKAIVESVIDFEDTNNDEDFDFMISKKEAL